ncbi:MAG: GyrI-like domain-containing protein [Bacteroidota bacterium]
MQNVRIEPFHVIGIAKRTSNANGQAAKEIAELWQVFLSENIQEKIPNKVDLTVYSMYTEYEGDHLQPYTVILCCKVEHLDAIPEGMIGKSIEGGDYIRLSAKGDLAQGLIVDQWMKIWEMDLNRAYTADFEVFGEKAQDPSNAEVDFLIAIK